MSDAALARGVGRLMREVAGACVMRRFRNLQVGDVATKGAPDDLVTVADRESEARLAEGLATLDRDGRIVGEEAVAADTSLLDGLGEGRVWLIDPLDGTGNFAAGRTPFGLLVALVEDGEPVAGWLLDPVADRLCHARRGAGAFVDGEQVASHGTGAPRPVVALSTYLPPEIRAISEQRARGVATLADMPRCAAEQYPRIGLGAVDAALFHRTLPWDHAAGVVWLEEAGGQVRRLDGATYKVNDKRPGLLAAATPALWDGVALALGHL